MIVSDKAVRRVLPGGMGVGVGLLVLAGRRLAEAAQPQSGAAGMVHDGAMESFSTGSWVLLIILALFVGFVTLKNLNRKYGDKGKRRQIDDEKPATPEAFFRAVIRRAPVVLEMIDDGDYEELPPLVEMVVEALQYRAGALRLEDPDGRALLFSPGTETGVDAAGNWFFTLDDPGAVQGCQVVFRFAGDRVFLFTDCNSAGPASTGDEPAAVQSLEVGGRVAWNDVVYFSVEKRLETGGLVLDIEHGAEAGHRLVLADEEFVPAAIDSEMAGGLPEVTCSFRLGRCLLTIGKVDARHRLELENPAFPYKLRPDAGQTLVLCPGDQLLDAAGLCCYKVGLVPAGKCS